MPAMQAELVVLALSVVLGLVHVMAAAAAGLRQRGLTWAAGPRDEPRAVTGKAARLARAQANFMETFPFFAAAVLTAYLGGRLGPLTYWGAMLYLAGRALYLPAYAYGFVGRPAFWGVSMVGLLMAVAALFVRV